MLPDKFPFLCSDFLLDLRTPTGSCVVKNIKGDYMTFSAGLLQDAVFAVAACFDSYIMLRYPVEHICTFSYINDLVIQLYAVDSCVLVFRSISHTL